MYAAVFDKMSVKAIWDTYTLVRYVIFAISVAQIDFIVFMASLGVKSAKNIGVQFCPPLNLVFMTHSKWPPSKSHIWP